MDPTAVETHCTTLRPCTGGTEFDEMNERVLVSLLAVFALAIGACGSKTNSGAPSRNSGGTGTSIGTGTGTGSTGNTGESDTPTTVQTLAPTSAPTTPPATAAPATAPPTVATGPPASCYIDPEGNCYRAGEYCPNAKHGQTVQGESGPITCEDNNGWRWENS